MKTKAPATKAKAVATEEEEVVAHDKPERIEVSWVSCCPVVCSIPLFWASQTHFHPIDTLFCSQARAVYKHPDQLDATVSKMWIKRELGHLKEKQIDEVMKDWNLKEPVSLWVFSLCVG